MNDKFRTILRQVYRGDFSTIPDRLLCLDPGETTGWCLFEKGELIKYNQEDTVILSTDGKQGTKIIDWRCLEDLFFFTAPTKVVCENYRIYAHKLERHSFSQVETLRLIGGIDQLCHTGWFDKHYPDDYGIDGDPTNLEGDPNEVRAFNYHQPISIDYQMAVQAKGFVTDERLKEWGFWLPGMRHSRDAIRHGIYWLLVTNRPELPKK